MVRACVRAFVTNIFDAMLAILFQNWRPVCVCGTPIPPPSALLSAERLLGVCCSGHYKAKGCTDKYQQYIRILSGMS